MQQLSSYLLGKSAFCMIIISCGWLKFSNLYLIAFQSCWKLHCVSTCITLSLCTRRLFGCVHSQSAKQMQQYPLNEKKMLSECIYYVVLLQEIGRNSQEKKNSTAQEASRQYYWKVKKDVRERLEMTLEYKIFHCQAENWIMLFLAFVWSANILNCILQTYPTLPSLIIFGKARPVLMCR